MTWGRSQSWLKMHMRCWAITRARWRLRVLTTFSWYWRSTSHFTDNSPLFPTKFRSEVFGLFSFFSSKHMVLNYVFLTLWHKVCNIIWRNSMNDECVELTVVSSSSTPSAFVLLATILEVSACDVSNWKERFKNKQIRLTTNTTPTI